MKNRGCCLHLFKITVIILNGLKFYLMLIADIYCINMFNNKNSVTRMLNFVQIPNLPIPDAVSGLLLLGIIIFSITLTISFCGCYGACWERKFFLELYALTTSMWCLISILMICAFLCSRNHPCKPLIIGMINKTSNMIILYAFLSILSEIYLIV